MEKTKDASGSPVNKVQENSQVEVIIIDSISEKLKPEWVKALSSRVFKHLSQSSPEVIMICI